MAEGYDSVRVAGDERHAAEALELGWRPEWDRARIEVTCKQGYDATPEVWLDADGLVELAHAAAALAIKMRLA